MFDLIDIANDLAKTLVWPALILTLVYWFRGPIREALDILPRLKKVRVGGQEIELRQLEDDISVAVEKAIAEVKRVFPAHKSGRLLSFYKSDETAYYVHMIEAFEKIGINITDTAIFNAVGHHYFATNKHKSRIYYEKALKIDQNDIDAHTNLAFWHLRLGNDISAAEQECRIAQRIIENDGSSYPWTYVCLSTIYERLELKDKQNAALETAKQMFLSHIDEDHANFWAYFGLGWCWSKQNNLDNAVIFTNECIKIKPDFQAARYNLACFSAKRGKPEDALKQLRILSNESNQMLKFFSIESDSDFDKIASDKEFVAFMNAINLEHKSQVKEHSL
jgi:tetratricopeptide (TPR) repeat protein